MNQHTKFSLRFQNKKKKYLADNKKGVNSNANNSHLDHQLDQGSFIHDFERRGLDEQFTGLLHKGNI